jgi:hypothetical protein
MLKRDGTMRPAYSPARAIVAARLRDIGTQLNAVANCDIVSSSFRPLPSVRLMPEFAPKLVYVAPESNCYIPETVGPVVLYWPCSRPARP